MSNLNNTENNDIFGISMDEVMELCAFCYKNGVVDGIDEYSMQNPAIGKTYLEEHDELFLGKFIYLVRSRLAVEVEEDA